MQQELKALLLEEHSKQQRDKIVQVINGDQRAFDALISCLWDFPAPVPQRAAWAVDACCSIHPNLLMKHVDACIENLPAIEIDGIKRSLLKALSLIDLSATPRLGELVDYCFACLTSAHEKVAAKVHAMQILFNSCKTYPELGNELQLILEEALPYEQAGYVSRGKKILKKLNQP